ELKPRERYFSELVNPASDDQLAARQPGLFRAELHERFGSPLYPFAFVMLAVAFIGKAQTTRQNRVEAIVLAFLIAAGCRLAGLAANNIVALNASAVWTVYAIPLGAMVLSVAVMRTRIRRRRLPYVSDIVAEIVAWITSLVRRPRRAEDLATRGGDSARA
ncbi:MAG TPA: LptF/LptG family permease, partial [Hyphomicrobiaceae bacterium]|nr:LptF/LptG family permease [Hyphomicrobiaceae bacterium]